MRKVSIAALVLGLFVVSSGFAQPKIKSVEGTDLKFGDAFAGSMVEHKVVIKNEGTDTLRIRNVRAQCGCTATLINQKALAPSDTTSLTITFNTRGYNGRAIKHVYVDSNDPVTPQLTIGFETNVITALALSPSYLSVRTLKPDSLSHSVVTVVNQFGKDVEITGVKAVLDTALMNSMQKLAGGKDQEWDKSAAAQLKPAFRSTLGKESLKPGEQTELTVDFRAPRPGNYQGIVTLSTNVKQIPQYEIRFFAEVK